MVARGGEREEEREKGGVKATWSVVWLRKWPPLGSPDSRPAATPQRSTEWRPGEWLHVSGGHLKKEFNANLELQKYSYYASRLTVS